MQALIQIIASNGPHLISRPDLYSAGTQQHISELIWNSATRSQYLLELVYPIDLIQMNPTILPRMMPSQLEFDYSCIAGTKPPNRRLHPSTSLLHKQPAAEVYFG